MLLTVVKVKMVHGNLTGHKTVHFFVVVVAIVESYSGINQQIGQYLIFLTQKYFGCRPQGFLLFFRHRAENSCEQILNTQYKTEFVG